MLQLKGFEVAPVDVRSLENWGKQRKTGSRERYSVRDAALREAVSRPSCASWRVVAGGALVEVTKPRSHVLAALELPAQLIPEGAGGRPPEAAAAAPLGNNADFASPPPTLDVHAILPPPSTVKAWRLRSYGREILARDGNTKRIRWCGSRISRGSDGVGVYARPDRAYGRVQGVCVCGQSLACPVCAPRIAAFRAAEVSECFARASKLGVEARLETFTIPHVFGNELGSEVDVFAEAWRRMNSGKKAAKANEGAFGHHVGREVTWSTRNGWHYHHHRCRYDEVGTFDEERARAHWLAALRSVGRYTPDCEEHAYDCGVIGDEAHAAYVGKLATAVEAQARAIGSEIASAATKGRNMATLLLDASQGDAWAGKVWLAGVAAITERKISSVRWSRGLRAKVGMQKEKSDEAIAREEVLPTDVFLGALTPAQWRGILMHRAEFALCCAANQGADAVNSFLAGLELGQLNDDARPAVAVPLQDETCYSVAGLPADVVARLEKLKNEPRV